MAEHTRRDFIKWVVYLGTVAALPKVASPEECPHDVLEGISTVNKEIADLSGNRAKFRLAEDDAFERCMQDTWRVHNGHARYVRVFQDMGIVPEKHWIDEAGGLQVQAESYVTFFQYRRA